MEKFFKSIFTSDKKKNSDDNSEGDRSDFSPPLDGRRKLSISRSGRMRQANKKRHSLSLDVYGDTNQSLEKQKPREYHVNKIAIASENKSQRRKSLEPDGTSQVSKPENLEKVTQDMEVKTPEEQIENAFQVIDNVL